MNSASKARMENWHVVSPTEAGMHNVIEPKQSDCEAVHIFRLNLEAGSCYTLESKELEMNAVLVQGAVTVDGSGLCANLEKLDSFYISGNSVVTITALQKSALYIGAAQCEGYGQPFMRKCDRSLPLGEIHQIHGEDAGRREVFFTLNPEQPASRLICGITWGENGAWTSWPPHQHELDLEEVYCYFDMESPQFGLHLSYLSSEDANHAVAHVVSSSSMVLAPCGYHPTVATPGTCNTYFWVLAALSHNSRRYDLAITDPNYEKRKGGAL